jgi:hypothetical protein
VTVLVFSLVCRLYTAPLSCSSSFTGLCSSCTETWLLLYNIFAVQKKKKFKLNSNFAYRVPIIIITFVVTNLSQKIITILQGLLKFDFFCSFLHLSNSLSFHILSSGKPLSVAFLLFFTFEIPFCCVSIFFTTLLFYFIHWLMCWIGNLSFSQIRLSSTKCLNFYSINTWFYESLTILLKHTVSIII